MLRDRRSTKRHALAAQFGLLLTCLVSAHALAGSPPGILSSADVLWTVGGNDSTIASPSCGMGGGGLCPGFHSVTLPYPLEPAPAPDAAATNGPGPYDEESIASVDNSNGSVEGVEYAEATVEFVYSVEVLGPAPTVAIDAYSVAGSGATGFASAYTQGVIQGTDGETVFGDSCAPANSCGGFSNDVAGTVVFQGSIGTPITVTLYAHAQASVGGTAYAQIDPVFSIDPSVPNASAYQILVSPGVTNGASGSAAPEPSTWAMMLIGFLGLGIAARRSRGNRAAACSDQAARRCRRAGNARRHQPVRQPTPSQLRSAG